MNGRCPQCGSQFERRHTRQKYCCEECQSLDTRELQDSNDFWQSLDMASVPGCWLWVKALDTDGYGLFRQRKKLLKAHRYAHEIAIGPLLKGMLVCHTCDHPACCRPAHIYAGTPKQNVQDQKVRNRPMGIHGTTESERKARKECAQKVFATKGKEPTSKYPWVYLRRRDGKWAFAIRINKKVVKAARGFLSEQEAVIARDTAYKQLTGEAIHENQYSRCGMA